MTAVVMLALALATGEAQTPSPPQAPVIQKNNIRYQVVARGARLNRRVMGDVTDSVRGVPASPVDSLVYDGVGSTPIEGAIVILEVDPVKQTGLLRAKWTDRNGSWEVFQDFFHHPEHSSGIRIGSSKDEVDSLINVGIAQNVYLHGDTGGGTPIFPTVFTYLAAWGFTHVTLDGEPFLNKYGLPGPERWVSHTMLTEGVRNDDGTVRALGGEIYDPKRHKTVGAVDPTDMELHLEFMDERFPTVQGNNPAMFAFQYHLVFEDVVMQLTESQQPLGFADADRMFGESPE
jgi:hypothetical protein